MGIIPINYSDMIILFGEGGSVQAEIDTLIGRCGNEGRGILYTLSLAKDTDIKPWWLIQCQYDETPYVTHRNPDLNFNGIIAEPEK